MCSTQVTQPLICDLFRLERTNMISKMEDRIKADLETVSLQVLHHLGHCTATDLPVAADMITKLAVQFNQGSLVEYQAGEIQRAEELCCGEVEVFAELSDRSPHRALCLANMIPPYINLARIYGQKGWVEESQRILNDVYNFGKKEEDLTVLGHRISGAEAQAIFAAAPSYQKVMLSCKVLDAARGLQTVDDYAALLELVTSLSVLPEYQEAFFKKYFSELRCRVLVALGHFEEAMEAFTEYFRQIPSNSIDRVLSRPLLSQIYRKWGRSDLAYKTLNELEGHLTALEGIERKPAVLRQIAYQLSLERYLLGDGAGARTPAEKAFQWCNEWHDQPGSIRSAILLLRLSRDVVQRADRCELQRRWFNELQRLADTTLFCLDRACAYWELGAAAFREDDPMTACALLENSHSLFCSIPFVDSIENSKKVERLLAVHGHMLSGQREGIHISHASIDAMFLALMEYVPSSPSYAR
jgi:tetratricopeptide (TPR) repeat protein